MSATSAPAIHSTAVAEHNDLWVFVTGRVDGLHLLFDGEAFRADMSNNEIIIYDPDADQVWSASLDELSDALADPLHSTNAQHHQNGNTLYVLGGYGMGTATRTRRK